MDDSSILGSALGQLGQTVKQTAKQTVKIPEEMAGNSEEQIKGSAEQNSSAKQNADGDKNLNSKPQWASDEERIKFLRDLYGSSAQPSPEATAGKVEKKQTTSANPLVKAEKKKNATSADPLVKATEKPTEFQEKIADKSPEEQKKLLELRNQLHKDTYYDPTFNRPKSPPAGGEERPAEKVENEKKQEMQELQKKEEKKAPPLAVQRERNKAEMFRGVAG